MKALEEKILKEGIVKEGNVLKVDSFLNHQIDVSFLEKMGEEFKELFKDGLYYENGKRSMKMASILIEGLKSLNVKFHYPPESNQVFIKLNTKAVDKLRKNNAFEIIEKLDEDTLVLRFVTNYRTTEEEINNLLEDLRRL